MNNKLLLILGLLFLSVSASGEVVSQQQAKKQAADFFRSILVQTKSSYKTVTIDDMDLICSFPELQTKSQSSEPALYVFGFKEGGYVIVSADDVARPVLGYSLDGFFSAEKMPDNLRYLLQWYSDAIRYAKDEMGAESDSYDLDLDPSKTVQLETARWDQGHPFNDLVPTIDGVKPPIGCVATAIAIVMQYHKWPTKGTGVLPGYEYKNEWGTFIIDSVDISTHAYDWSLMPSEPNSLYYHNHYTGESAAQISRLLYDVAVMSQISFGKYESGGYTYAARSLTRFFGYDKQITFHLRRCFTNAKWEAILREEIDGGRPVIYGGSEFGSSSHAFVIDGYNGRYFSVNFGWGGYCSGFYTLTPIEGLPDNIRYNTDHTMVCKIMPDQGGPYIPNIYNVSTIALPSDFGKDNDFEYPINLIDYNSLYNEKPDVIDADLSVVLYDYNNNVKSVISPIVHLNSLHDSPKSLICRVNTPLSDGDMIAPSIRYKSTSWIPIDQPEGSKLRFSGRPISELLKIGFVEDNQARNTSQYPNREKRILLYVHKGLLWAITNNGEILYDNSRINNKIDNRVFYIKQPYSYNYSESGEEWITLHLWASSGDYSIRITNPVTNETIRVNLEL